MNITQAITRILVNSTTIPNTLLTNGLTTSSTSLVSTTTSGAGNQGDFVNDDDDQDPDIVTRNGIKYFLSAAYVFILVFGLFGNLIIVYVVLKNRQLRQIVTNIFITNLAVSDIMMAVLCVPFTPLYSFIGSWIFGSFLCKVLGMAQCMSVYLATLTLMIIAYDRYRVVLYPFNPRMTMKGCLIRIGIIWLVSAVISFPLAIFQKLSTYPDSSVIFCEEKWPSHTIRIVYSFFNIIAQFIVPLALIAYFYHVVSVEMDKKSKKQIHGMKKKSERRDIKRKKRMNIMLITMIILFSLCWLPLNVVIIFFDMRQDLWRWKYYTLVFFVSHLIAMSSICQNPILYAWFNPIIRAEINNLFPCLLKRVPTIASRESIGFTDTNINEGGAGAKYSLAPSTGARSSMCDYDFIERSLTEKPKFSGLDNNNNNNKKSKKKTLRFSQFNGSVINRHENKPLENTSKIRINPIEMVVKPLMNNFTIDSSNNNTTGKNSTIKKRLLNIGEGGGPNEDSQNANNKIKKKSSLIGNNSTSWNFDKVFDHYQEVPQREASLVNSSTNKLPLTTTETDNTTRRKITLNLSNSKYLSSIPSSLLGAGGYNINSLNSDNVVVTNDNLALQNITNGERNSLTAKITKARQGAPDMSRGNSLNRDILFPSISDTISPSTTPAIYYNQNPNIKTTTANSQLVNSNETITVDENRNLCQDPRNNQSSLIKNSSRNVSFSNSNSNKMMNNRCLVKFTSLNSIMTNSDQHGAKSLESRLLSLDDSDFISHIIGPSAVFNKKLNYNIYKI